MRLARVVGRVWSTVKTEGLSGQRLLILQPVTPELKDHGKPMLATDCVSAGAGEIVYWCRGPEASFPFLPEAVPTDCNIVAIVDELHVKRTPSADR
jgi:microcompartment protein CcmK/EutM